MTEKKDKKRQYNKIIKSDDWFIKDSYTKMIKKYETMLGQQSEYGVIITENFIMTLKKRLAEIQIKEISNFIAPISQN
tara:strand:+ start:2471 stop:2704 length:234 start_codon:yes stop_codon:yes gene_type:complete